MPTISAFIRISRKNIQKAYVRFRLTDGRSVQLYHKSEIKVEPNLWDEKRECYKAKVLIPSIKREKFNKSIIDRKNILLNIYNTCDKDSIKSEEFELLIDKFIHPEKYKDHDQKTLFSDFDLFMNKKNISKGRRNALLVVKRILQRFELFISISENTPYSICFDNITPATLDKMEDFIRNEHEIYKNYPSIYEAVPETREPKPRGHNRIVSILSMIRSFIIWANKTDRTKNNPFNRYSIPEEVYGTPIYITLEERNAIHKKDLSGFPSLSIQKDIFIFQCLVGCRVGDLIKLKKENIINNAIEYIPEKTKEERPKTVRVPLNDTAIQIIEKHKDVEKNGKLLPFISEQKYNQSIKKIFELCEITRTVTILNPITREEEKKPLNEIASSHLARRTFIGNLYKKVKDPNLVGSLSGHKEGSRAFSRYRDIDEDIKKELIKLLD